MLTANATGPEAMPVFSDTTITPAQKRDIIDCITRLRAEPNPGGFSLGRIGPVTEGIVGFLGGIGVLIFIAMWITMKRRGNHDETAESGARLNLAALSRRVRRGKPRKP